MPRTNKHSMRSNSKTSANRKNNKKRHTLQTKISSRKTKYKRGKYQHKTKETNHFSRLTFAFLSIIVAVTLVGLIDSNTTGAITFDGVVNAGEGWNNSYEGNSTINLTAADDRVEFLYLGSNHSFDTAYDGGDTVIFYIDADNNGSFSEYDFYFVRSQDDFDNDCNQRTSSGSWAACTNLSSSPDAGANWNITWNPDDSTAELIVNLTKTNIDMGDTIGIDLIYDDRVPPFVQYSSPAGITPSFPTDIYVWNSYTTAPDATAPTWTNNQANITTPDPIEAVNLSAQVQDETGLQAAWLETNETGSWKNFTSDYGSPFYLSGTAQVWANFTWLNASLTDGQSFGWRIHVNDTLGNVNSTDIAYITITDDTGPTITLNFPPDDARAQNGSVEFSFTPTDLTGIMNCSIWGNFDGTWALKATNNSALTNNSEYKLTHIVNTTIDRDAFWNVQCSDNAATPTSTYASENFTLTVQHNITFDGDWVQNEYNTSFPGNSTLNLSVYHDSDWLYIGLNHSFDIDHNQFDRDWIYVDTDNSGSINTGDIRLDERKDESQPTCREYNTTSDAWETCTTLNSTEGPDYNVDFGSIDNQTSEARLNYTKLGISSGNTIGVAMRYQNDTGDYYSPATFDQNEDSEGAAWNVYTLPAGIDTTPPTWTNNQANITTPDPGEVVNLSAQVQDTTGLQAAWLETNETGNWQNFTSDYGSPFYLTGTAQVWVNFTWVNSSVTHNTAFGWRIHVNDTSGNENVTDIAYVTVTDDTIPEIRSISQTAASLIQTDTIYLWAQGQDNGALDAAWLETNETGVFVNWTAGKYSSPIDMNDSQTTWIFGNFTWTNSSLEGGKGIGWRIWFNDTAGNINSTQITIFTLNRTISISLINTEVNFSSMDEGENDNTTDDVPLPFVVRNTGNYYVNVSVLGAQLFSAVAHPTNFYQLASNENETSSTRNLTEDVFPTFQKVPLAAGNFILNLNWTDLQDEVRIEVNLTVPPDEPAGVKGSILTITGSEA